MRAASPVNEMWIFGLPRGARSLPDAGATVRTFGPVRARREAGQVTFEPEPPG